MHELKSLPGADKAATYAELERSLAALLSGERDFVAPRRPTPGGVQSGMR